MFNKESIEEQFLQQILIACYTKYRHYIEAALYYDKLHSPCMAMVIATHSRALANNYCYVQHEDCIT